MSTPPHFVYGHSHLCFVSEHAPFETVRKAHLVAMTDSLASVLVLESLVIGEMCSDSVRGAEI